jgi:hypothetical protein
MINKINNALEIQKIKNHVIDSNDKIPMSEEWKSFCNKLQTNLSNMETEANLNISKSRNMGVSFEERKNLIYKLKWIKNARAKLEQKRKFNLQADDWEIINAVGFEHWFRIYDYYLIGN